ncbi:MAG: hypothetical protein JWL72_298 [Ilumatobacteraceae bacterium]|nr:hypothetical protein [Ilumatobacteraceae bacterium]MCU1386960.1 hypothetical protein [Ilumatobacteraceae bacterium]
MQTQADAPSADASRTPAWILRVVWLLQPLAFVPLLGDATSTLPDVGKVIAAVLAWATWTSVLLATFVPSTVSITVGRLIAPLAPIVALTAGLGGAVAGGKLALGIGAGAIAVVVWFSGETGMVLAQGSAYGAEQRFPLKPPVPFVVPMAFSWLVLASSSVAGAVFLANERWVVGGALLVLAAVAGRFLGSRFHQLSRRWLVVVPAGLVVHDPLLLAENALFRVVDIAAVHLAPVGTEAADLTGGTAGVVIEIVLRETDTIVKAATADKPTGTALHVRSVLVSPSRPGRALAAAGARRMPVG